MPRRILTIGLLAAFLAVNASALPAREGETFLEGRVWAGSDPGAGSTVFVYEVATEVLERVVTDRRGRFSFQGLPAGLYKVVAHKAGYQPAVEVVLRRNRQEGQHVELRLARESGDSYYGEAFWEARRAIPPDILRELTGFGPSGPSEVQIADGDRLDLVTPVSQGMTTELSAAGGVQDLGAGMEGQRRSAGIGLKGSLGDLELGIRGRFEEVATQDTAAAGTGEVRALDVDLGAHDAAAFSVSTSRSEAPTASPLGGMQADLESHRIAWSGRMGDHGHSEISAGYVQEENFYRQGQLDPIDLPQASKTWNVEGQYRHALSEATSVEAGVRYQQRSTIDPRLQQIQPQDSIDVFGKADSRIRPRVLVEYGIFSSIRDENLSLVPHGGLVVELGKDWQARGSFAQRFDSDEDAIPLSFGSARFDDPGFCRKAGESCYEVQLSHGEELETLSVGAVHREFADTLRLYFSEDFFDRLQSLFVVRGDSLPELSFQVVRQISPRVLATLRSNVAEGGGGIFYATDTQAYENNIRYLVTSLDTRFQKTATGVFIAFHHLEQDLEPLNTQGSSSSNGSGLEMQRLQLMLTQDLSALANVANHFAVRFNMEVSRGTSPFTLTADDELQKRLTGGISVKF